MRGPRSSREAFVALACVIVASALGVPAAAAARTAGAPSSFGPCDQSTRAAIKAAFAAALDRSTTSYTVADRVGAVATTATDPALRALVERWAGTENDSTRSSRVEVRHLRCRGNTAQGDATLVLSGTKLPHVLPAAQAVRVDGTWRVSPASFCARLILGDPSLAAGGPCAAGRAQTS